MTRDDKFQRMELDNKFSVQQRSYITCVGSQNDKRNNFFYFNNNAARQAFGKSLCGEDTDTDAVRRQNSTSALPVN